MPSVFNKTQHTVIAKHLTLANNPFSRLLGLMGKTSFPESSALQITPCNSIHSFFMRFEFDAVFIDKHQVVVHIVERMKPWRMSALVLKAHSVIELNPGVIAESNTTVGDHLAIE
jgi:uncharacterized protein